MGRSYPLLSLNVSKLSRIYLPICDILRLDLQNPDFWLMFSSQKEDNLFTLHSPDSEQRRQLSICKVRILSFSVKKFVKLNRVLFSLNVNKLSRIYLPICFIVRLDLHNPEKICLLYIPENEDSFQFAKLEFFVKKNVILNILTVVFRYCPNERWNPDRQDLEWGHPNFHWFFCM